jgi:hypothetical protein
VPSGELDRLRETIDVLADTELVRDLRGGLADARPGACSQLSRSLPTSKPARCGRMSEDTPYAVVFTPTARRRLDKLPLGRRRFGAGNQTLTIWGL